MARNDLLLEEDIVDALMAAAEEEIADLMDRLAPAGRPPFTTKLSESEQWVRLWNATPEDWLAMQAEIAEEPDDKVRARRLAELFAKQTTIQQAKFVLGVE